MYKIIKTSKFSKSYKKLDEKYIKFIDLALARLFS